MDNRRLILLLITLLPLFAEAQVTVDTKDYQIARKVLRVGTDKSKYFTSTVEAISEAATHHQCPSAKAVFDFCQKALTIGDGLVWIGEDTLDWAGAQVVSPIIGSGTGPFPLGIANNSITQSHIATDGVGSSEIAADAVGASEIAADAVGSSEIATDAVGAAEIAADAVGSSEIATDAVTNAEIAADAVGSSEIATDAVTSDEIAPNAVGTSEIIDGTVANADLANMPAHTFKMNNTGSAGAPIDATISQVKTELNLSGTNSGDQHIDTLSLSGTILSASLSGDGVPAKTVDLSTVSPTITASNGLTKTGNDIALGGTGTGSTLINWVANLFEMTWNSLAGGSGLKLSSNSTAATGNTQKLVEISLTGTNATSNQSTTALHVTNGHLGTGAVNYAVYGTVSNGASGAGVTGAGSGGLPGVVGTSGSGPGVTGQSSSGTGGNFSTTTGVAVNGVVFTGTTNPAIAGLSVNASGNTVLDVGRLQVQTNTTAAAGLGVGQSFVVEVSDGSTVESNEIISKWTKAGVTNYTSDLIITGRDSIAEKNLLTLSGNGTATFNQYGSGNITGTLAKVSGFTSAGKLIELTPNVSGTATLVAGTVTVSTGLVATGDKIIVGHNTFAGTPGILEAPTGSIVNATSFVINSTSNTDTSTVNYIIVKHD